MYLGVPIDLSVGLWGDNFSLPRGSRFRLCVYKCILTLNTRTHTYNLTDTHTHIELYILINHGYRLQRDQTQRFFHPSAAIERKKKKRTHGDLPKYKNQMQHGVVVVLLLLVSIFCDLGALLEQC